jgi:nucleoredoxin
MHVCRQFTPRLTQFYNEMKQAGKPFEVVFVSCDRDPKSFGEYLTHMPWSAVAYDSPAREQV